MVVVEVVMVNLVMQVMVEVMMVFVGVVVTVEIGRAHV